MISYVDLQQRATNTMGYLGQRYVYAIMYRMEVIGLLLSSANKNNHFQKKFPPDTVFFPHTTSETVWREEVLCVFVVHTPSAEPVFGSFYRQLLTGPILLPASPAFTLLNIWISLPMPALVFKSGHSLPPSELTRFRE